VTTGDVLDPPGCGSQCQTSFCPGGCSTDGLTCLNYYTSLDGGLGTCAASQLSPSHGELASSGVAVYQGLLVVLSSSAAVACAVSNDGGTVSGTALVLDIPTNQGGMLNVSDRPTLATLVIFDDGGVTRTPATSGSVFINTVDPNGGAMGQYSLQLSTGTEEGSFVAPACDVCATPP
jgi:hypothetical protein